MDLDDYQTSFLLYAPARNPHGWNLDLPSFAETLQATFPEARCAAQQSDVSPGTARLQFYAVTDEGEEFDGLANTDGRDNVLLIDNTAAEAAVFIEWLRDSVLADPDLIRFSSELAVESGIETDWRVPAVGDREAIIDELQQHIRVVAGT
ncbi:hypothetical protein ACIREE_30960 [Streptomyces sp. NPDC102467]|uniref:hypothetical protein n=1 Tax=Streptomyces sp. NPDC102467 TaxID=3366179 RepID=UPI003829A093